MYFTYFLQKNGMCNELKITRSVHHCNISQNPNNVDKQQYIQSLENTGFFLLCTKTRDSRESFEPSRV